MSHKHKFIFFCNGRTGTRSIEYALKKYDDNAKHPFLWRIVELIREELPLPNKILPGNQQGFLGALRHIGHLPYEGKIKFSGSEEYIAEHIPPVIVKNTLGEDLWNEYFKFVFVRNPWSWVISCYFCHDKREIKRMKKFTKDKFFKHWEQMKQCKVIKEAENSFQHSWVIDDSGKPLVDFIGRFENLQEDFNIACDRAGIPRQILPKKNVTNSKLYREYYTEETKQLVAERYHKDIELFGYEY